MPYTVTATTRTPALVIYLLDVSASMSQPLGHSSRLAVVTEALTAAWRQMVYRATKGQHVAPRYRIALFAYSDGVFDLLEGVQPLDQVVRRGVPELQAMRTTETGKAFAVVEKLLEAELPKLRDCPAPVVCHMTDGEHTGADPEPVVARIMQKGVPDGRVLVENIFVSDRILPEPVADPSAWPGILPETRLENEYARRLRQMSSPIPESYREMMLENNYHLAPGALMLLPGMNPELVAMGFQMSAATPVSG